MKSTSGTGGAEFGGTSICRSHPELHTGWGYGTVLIINTKSFPQCEGCIQSFSTLHQTSTNHNTADMLSQGLWATLVLMISMRHVLGANVTSFTSTLTGSAAAEQSSDCAAIVSSCPFGQTGI